MPINHDMMHAQSNDEVATLKARIAELERRDTEHTVQIAKMNAYIRELEDAQRWRKYPSEQPPYTVSYIITCTKHKCIDFNYWHNHAGKWQFKFYDDEVIGWMPMPNVPEE